MSQYLKTDPLCKVNSQEDNASLPRACNTGEGGGRVEGGREGDGAVQSIPWATEKKKKKKTPELSDYLTSLHSVAIGRRQVKQVVGHRRAKQVGHRRAKQVGHRRAKQVGHRLAKQVGHRRAKQAGSARATRQRTRLQ